MCVWGGGMCVCVLWKYIFFWQNILCIYFFIFYQISHRNVINLLMTLVLNQFNLIQTNSYLQFISLYRDGIQRGIVLFPVFIVSPFSFHLCLTNKDQQLQSWLSTSSLSSPVIQQAASCVYGMSMWLLIQHILICPRTKTGPEKLKLKHFAIYFYYIV